MTSRNQITAEDLASVSRTRVFFGHQSVGMNVLGAVPGIYAEHGLTPPPIGQGQAQPGEDGGFIAHAFIGENEKPRFKIQSFDAIMRSGIGQPVDVAMMKFCYVDIKADTDIVALYARYRDTLAALERDFPEVVFVHVTVPLMVDQGGLSRLKSRVTGNTRFGRAENVARERLNDLIRRESEGAYLFDLAAVESTGPDGKRATGLHAGEQYFHLYGGYASDPGHLNGDGARAAAVAWLRTIAQAGKEGRRA